MCSTPQRFLDEVARRYLQGSQILKTTKQPILLRGSTEYEIQYNGIRTLVFFRFATHFWHLGATSSHHIEGHCGLVTWCDVLPLFGFLRTVKTSLRRIRRNKRGIREKERKERTGSFLVRFVSNSRCVETADDGGMGAERAA